MLQYHLSILQYLNHLSYAPSGAHFNIIMKRCFLVKLYLNMKDCRSIHFLDVYYFDHLSAHPQKMNSFMMEVPIIQKPFHWFTLSWKSKKNIKLKACVHYFLSNFYLWLNDSPSTNMKNGFYFILKALFVLEIFNFLYFCLPLFFSPSAIALEVYPRKILKFLTPSTV